MPDGALNVPTAQRLFQMAAAMSNGRSSQQIIAETAIDPWYVAQLQEILEIEGELGESGDWRLEIK
jgi:carbamoyl-phosphate synthase large subunit